MLVQNRLVIRADASPRIGTGHVMRCIALGQAWQDKGGEVTFVSHCESDALKNRIVEEGFNLVGVAVPYPDGSDIEYTLKVLTDNGNETWLVLDGYHFDPEYQKCILDAGYRLLVIDDMNHLPFYYADILLNQNIYAPDLQYKFKKDTIQLRGSEYVLLRRKFLAYMNEEKIIGEYAKKILVTMGGADPDNTTQKVIIALKIMGCEDSEVKVIAGPANQYVDSIKNELFGAPFKYELLTDTFDMPALMLWADFAVSAAGSTVWELAFMKVPTISVVLSENQERIASYLSKFGIVFNVGIHDKLNVSELSKTLKMLISCKNSRKKMTEIGSSKIDGRGAKRIIENMDLFNESFIAR